MTIQIFSLFLYTTWHGKSEEPLSAGLVELPV